VPTRKQRRRRDKDFRHDVRVFEVDEEGNEVPIAELRQREEQEKPKPAKQQPKTRGGRQLKEVQPPSWERAFRRGGLMGGAMLLVFLFLLKSGPVAQRVAIGVFYAVAFIPLTYWIDRTAYRSYQKRMNRAASAGGGKSGKPAAKKG
jgi:predicted lipid-binding transport protein (Tim44 family)